MRTIGSEVAEVVAGRSDMAGTVSSAFDTNRAAGQSRRRSCAVAVTAFHLSRSWLIRATHATQASILPEEIRLRIWNRSDARLPLLPTLDVLSFAARLSRWFFRPRAFAFQAAQQGARANAGICHAACYGMPFSK
jgi:hypothetical protein